MMKNQRKPWCTALALILILALIVPVLAACDDDDDDDITTTTQLTATTQPATTTESPTETETGTPASTVSDEPVKMGVCVATSGSMAMASQICKPVLDMVEQMVEDNGGIQVGSVKRPVDFIWYDDKGEVSGTIAGWKKLVGQDHISIMAMGGVSGAQCEEMVAQSEEYKIPYVDYSGEPNDLTNHPYAVRVGMRNQTSSIPVEDLLRDLQPKTVALLGDQEASDHFFFGLLKDGVLEEIGAKVVYEQYVTVGTADYAPFLTKIKYENPDVLIQFSASFQAYGSVYGNIDGLGGWGDMTYIGAMLPANMWQKLSSAVGTYQWVLWAPEMDNPGTKEYLQACETYGVKPDPNHMNFWNAAWTAIYAVEQAGIDDPEKIIETLRSGTFQWEAPTGLLQIGTDGEPYITGAMVRIGEGGQITLIE